MEDFKIHTVADSELLGEHFPMFLSHRKAAVYIFFSKHVMIWECHFNINNDFEVALPNQIMFAEEYIYTSAFQRLRNIGKCSTCDSESATLWILREDARRECKSNVF